MFANQDNGGGNDADDMTMVKSVHKQQHHANALIMPKTDANTQRYTHVLVSNRVASPHNKPCKSEPLRDQHKPVVYTRVFPNFLIKHFDT